MSALEYKTQGEGPAVLALHGAMGGWDQSLMLARTIIGAPGFRIIAVSRPGYLGTPLQRGQAPDQQADLCATLLDELGIGTAAVIAVSGGGQCALQFALRHPDRCRALVMVSACSAPIGKALPWRFHLMKLAAYLPGLAAAMRRRAAQDPERMLRRAAHDPELYARLQEDAEARSLLVELQLSTMERMRERMVGTMNDIRQSRLPFAYPVERIAAPALVVHGTDDEAAPFEHAQALAARVPCGELFALERARHVAIFTHRREVRPRVTEFLRSSSPGGRTR